MAKKALILRWGASAYDALGGLIELTAREFTALGVDVIIFAADGEDWPRRLVQLLAQGDIGFALTMSGIATDLLVDGKLIWETAKVPLFNWNCDHPCYYPGRHAIRNPFLCHGYVFPDHARYNTTHLPANGSAFAVHLGIPSREFFPNAPLPAAARNGRILFTKSGQDINAVEAKWRGFGPDLRDIVFAAAETLFPLSTNDFVPVLQRIAEPRGLFLNGNNRLMMLLIRELDPYIRYKRANLVIDAIRPYPVDVFGTGWDHIDWTGGEARFHGASAWHASMEQLPRYTGCLSTNPLVEESVHDRVFAALAAGVPPISDNNAFARQHMPALAPYSFAFTRYSVQQAIEAVLDQPAEAIAHTEETWEALSTSFGLRRSAIQIAQFCTLHNLNAPFGV